MRQTLFSSGYSRYADEDYDNYAVPSEAQLCTDLPAGFQLLYGEDYANESNKWSACSLGFHPDRETPGYRVSMHPYLSRKNSAMYPDSFECIVVDTRTQEEYDQSHIPGAILIPYDEVLEKAEGVLTDKNQLILVYCRSGRRSKLAAADLQKLGYTNIREFGGIIDWPDEVE